MPGGRDVDFGTEAVRVAEGLAELGELVSARVEQEPEGFPRFPAISVRPEGRDVGIRYDGLPWGYELGSLVGAILEAGKAEPTLRPESLEALGALDRELALDVFVTPT
jgi:alkyl hydroperoxide reductase subunit F